MLVFLVILGIDSALRLRAPRAYLVGVRADRPPLLVADWVVRQNTLLADDDHQVGIPNWPQPGIRPRDTSRGDRVRRIGYFGRLAMAPSFFGDPAFLAKLDALGLEFVPSENDWQNYQDEPQVTGDIRHLLEEVEREMSSLKRQYKQKRNYAQALQSLKTLERKVRAYQVELDQDRALDVDGNERRRR